MKSLLMPHIAGTLKSLLKEGIAAGLDLRWRRYSRLFVIDDTANWVLSWEARELRALAAKLGIRLPPAVLASVADRQAIFYSDQYAVLDPRNFSKNHRYGLAYFHGLPDKGLTAFDDFYSSFKKVADRISRIQVSNREVYEFFMNEGWSPEKVYKIPIGINIDFFPAQTLASRKAFRAKYNIPQEAVVIGSFQKDGDGWREGNVPKLIKGPDVLLRTIAILKPRVSDIFVLLSGPARGYVKNGLEKLGVGYRHIYVEDYPQVSELYRAIDAYIVSSRVEGGPKAVLESMASGVPLVSTRVGQAADLVEHKKNGWLVEVDDAEGLADGVLWFLEQQDAAQAVISCGKETALNNSYDRQLPAWQRFFTDFVLMS